MIPREIVRRAIEFEAPPRLPFWQRDLPDLPDDVWETREMDRAEAGWFFDNPVMDDWGCRWSRTERENMGQVVDHPLADWAAFAHYRPPNPAKPFYFERLGSEIDKARDRYVVVTSHFNLIERLHMLRGFTQTLEDFYLAPERIDRLLDMILEFKLAQLEELHRRFTNGIDGIFLTDDWGTQQQTFVGLDVFDRFFVARYRTLFDAIHGYGWHALLHSCGRVNDFVPRLIEAGVDVLNLQQPRAYGLAEFGERFRGKVCFLATVDIQATLPRGIESEVREEVRLLLEHWTTSKGGLIAFNYGDSTALGVPADMNRVMFDEFARHMHHWRSNVAD